MTIDPPPDLAIEIDITSRTHTNIYQSLGIPELWRKNGDHIEINILQDGKYIKVIESKVIPELPIDILIEYLAKSKLLGRNQVMKQFRQWLAIHIFK